MKLPIRNTGRLYPDTLSIDFAKRWGLEISPEICPVCKKEFEMNVPCAIKNYRGLEMENHGCEKQLMPAKYVPITENLKRRWEEALG